MANKTIKESIKDAFLALGGQPSALSDNTDTSDYIDDLADAIKDYVGEEASDIIDDSEASETKTFSSSKIASLIPEAELPAVTAEDNGKILAVVDGEWTKVTMTAVADTSTGAVTFTLTPDAPAQAET